MEALISQFTFLSDQALEDKSFDPSTFEDLMRLFEIESYKAWAGVEHEQEKAMEEADVIATQHADYEDYFDCVMESAMDELSGFEEELERMSQAEIDSLVDAAESATKMGSLVEKGASIASNRYIEAAVNSATASTKSALKGQSSSKVHAS